MTASETGTGRSSMDEKAMIRAVGWTALVIDMILVIGVGPILMNAMSFRDWILAVGICTFLFVAFSGVVK
jgi:hypothetical protein